LDHTKIIFIALEVGVVKKSHVHETKSLNKLVNAMTSFIPMSFYLS